MTAISITAASVVPGTGAIIEHGVAGAAINAGQAAYLDSAVTGKYQLADTNSATADARRARGIAVNSGALNQPLAIQTAGQISFGSAVLTQGVAYYLGETPGTIVPVADLTTGDYPCLLGIAESTSVLVLGIQSPGVAL